MRKLSVALLSLALTLSMSTNSSYAASQTVVETKPLQGNLKPAPHLAPTPSPTATPLAKPRFTISTRKAVLSTSMSTTVATATSTGGAIRSFSVSPALPRGLRLNTSTGEISGKPSFWQKAKSYKLNARNASGSYSQTLSVQVIRIPILRAGALDLGLNLRMKATGLKNTGGAATEYSISPELPQGLTLNSTTGQISGKPALAQPKRSYLLSATNISGTSTNKITIEIVSKPSVKLSKTNFLVSPNAIFSSYTIKNTGGRVYSYSISPALPSGLKLSPKTGKISGKVTSAHAKTKYTVTAKNPGGSFKTTLTLEILAAPSFKVGFYGFYPDAWLGKGATIDSPWLISEGGLISNVTITPALPEGIIFDPKTFKLSGTASSHMAKTNYTLTATNIAGTMSKPFSIEISDAPSVSMTPKNPIAYSANSNTEKLAVGSQVSGFTVSNAGDRIAAWSVFPELPHGLSLDQSTGEVTGTPDSYIESNELYTFTARNPGGTSSFTYRIQIVLPPVFAISSTSEELAIGSSLVGFNLYSVGGIVDSYSISPTLPAWLSFDTATGLLSGIADAVQALITFTITATNEAGTSSKDFSLEVFEAPQFTLTSSSEEAVNGSEISGYLINSTGGRITEYSISPELPTGLTLDTQTGLISGAPTADQAPVVYTITGTNVAGSDSHTFSLGVFSSPLLSLSPSNESAIVGQPITSYALALDASYGTPTGFSISPSVPAGLVFDSTNGSLSGTPTAAQLNVEYTVSASNVAGTSSQTFSLEVFSAPAFTLSKSSENAVNNVAISGYTINTSGGRVTEYSVSPELPTGLSLDTTTGLISGFVAVDQAPTTYTITGTNVAGSDSHTFALAIYSAPSFTMSSQTLIGSRGSTLVGYTLTQSGGTVTSYSVSPSLPAGVSLDSSTGLISGLPTNPQAITTYTLTATNVAGTSSQTFSLEVFSAPAFTLSKSSENAVNNAAISGYTINTSGGRVTEYSVSPELPIGLSLDTTTGLISGSVAVDQAPTTYTITGTNLAGSDSHTFALGVYSTPSFTMSSQTLIGSVGSSIVGYTLSQSGGTPTSYSVSPALPIGLVLNGSGLILGSPFTTQASRSYTLTATNVAGSYQSTFTIEVFDPPNITLNTASVAAFKDETSVSISAFNMGGKATSFSVTPTLPAGLGFNTSFGFITGIPTTLQDATEYTVSATNLGGTSSTKFTLSVKLSCAAGGDCSVGDIAPGGGKVVYVNQAGFACGVDLTSTCHYMEAAPQTWSGGSADPGESAYGTKMAVAGRTVLTQDTQTYTIGYGEYNTDLLVSAVGTYSTNPCAANHAAAYTSNYKGVSLDDWYLPNRTEMETVKNAGLTGIWALTGGRYWISTQQAGYMTEGGEANYLWSVGASLSSRALPATSPAYTRAVRTF